MPSKKKPLSQVTELKTDTYHMTLYITGSYILSGRNIGPK